jgi:hypothetical protein
MAFYFWWKRSPAIQRRFIFGGNASLALNDVLFSVKIAR